MILDEISSYIEISDLFLLDHLLILYTVGL